MKILHAVLSEGFYGSERYCIDLATAQARAGHQVAALIHGRDTNCARAFGEEIAATATAIAAEGMAGSIRLLVMPRALPAALHRPYALWTLIRLRPQIVHTHLNPAARRIGRVAQAIGISHVATLHIRFDPREYGRCDGLICGASWQRASIPGGFPGETALIRTWLPSDVHAALAATAADEVAALRRRWNADDRTVVFGSVGRLVSEKGMDLLVSAFRKAFPRGDETARLVIIGGGEEGPALEGLAAGDARIALMAPQPEIAPFYLAFDVYVSASRFEPFGLTILEAMDAGCALVVTRTEGPPEFLNDANVLWAKPNDVAALAAQLATAAAGGRRRPAYDLAPFAQPQAVAAIEAFYRRVIARRAKA